MAYIGTVNGELKFQGEAKREQPTADKVIDVYSKLIHVLQYTCMQMYGDYLL